jgi:hypothetical protein
MGVVIMELHSSWKWVALTKLQLRCNELHHIYNELQMFGVIQKLSCKASCKKPFLSCSVSLQHLQITTKNPITFIINYKKCQLSQQWIPQKNWIHVLIFSIYYTFFAFTCITTKHLEIIPFYKTTKNTCANITLLIKTIHTNFSVKH